MTSHWKFTVSNLGRVEAFEKFLNRIQFAAFVEWIWMWGVTVCYIQQYRCRRKSFQFDYLISKDIVILECRKVNWCIVFRKHFVTSFSNGIYSSKFYLRFFESLSILTNWIHLGLNVFCCINEFPQSFYNVDLRC